MAEKNGENRKTRGRKNGVISGRYGQGVEGNREGIKRAEGNLNGIEGRIVW